MGDKNAPPSRVIIHNSLAHNLHQTGSPFRAVVATPSGFVESPVSSQAASIKSLNITSTQTSAKHNGTSDTSGSGGKSPISVRSAAARERSLSNSQSREMVYVDSKERLSEMVTNIRGISNSLANVALAVPVETVLVVSKLSDDELPEHARELIEWLLRWEPHHERSSPGLEIAAGRRSCSTKRLTVLVEDVFVEKPEFGLKDMRADLTESQNNRLKFWSPDSPPEANNVDLVVTLGGDGTVLYTSWLFQKMVPPTLSFGLGSLGFMTENKFDDFAETLDRHLLDGICCALRMRFECAVMRTRNPDQTGIYALEEEINAAGTSQELSSHYWDGEYTILNEVVVDRGPNPFVTMTELYGNYELLTSIKADGVVISTPTGSTAYSMSAGGSLVHPDIPARLISPICPHTLSFRPLVVPDSMILHIGVPYDARSSAFVSFDGKARVELRRGDFLAINASPYPFPKVLDQGSSSVSWVQQLSRTLHWNEQKRPKRYTDGKTDNV